MSLPELDYKTEQTSTQLGKLVDELMTQHIAPDQARLTPVREAWARIAPHELVRHCRIKRFSRGELEVMVDTPVFLYELQICAQALLEALQMEIPQAGLKKIKLSLG